MSTPSLNFIKPLAGRALEVALNRALALDSDTQAELEALNGQRIVLALESPPLALQITVDGPQLRVGPVDSDNEPDLAIRSTLSGLFAQLPFMAARPRSGNNASGARIRLSGDAGLARQLQRLASGFDPDWQQPFVAVFGEILGVQIARALHAALNHARESAQYLAQSSVDYWVEESRTVIGKPEWQSHSADVQALKEDLNQLAARISRLQRRTDNHIEQVPNHWA